VRLSLSEAKGKLTELARRAEAGEEVILTRRGLPAVKLVSVDRKPTAAEKRRLMEGIMEEGRRKALPGPDAAHAADFLYDEFGLPK